MVDLMDMSLNDIITAAKEKSNQIKDRVVAEGEDLRRAWFKHVIVSIEKLNDRINELEDRIKELESHECKCSKDRNINIHPELTGR